MQLKHVVLNQVQESWLHFKCGKLVEVEQAREEQGDCRVPLVVLTFYPLRVLKLNFSHEYFGIDLQGQQVDDIDVRVEALG